MVPPIVPPQTIPIIQPTVPVAPVVAAPTVVPTIAAIPTVSTVPTVSVPTIAPKAQESTQPVTTATHEKEKEDKAKTQSGSNGASTTSADTVPGTSITTPSEFGPRKLIGYRVSIFWSDYDRWYPGTIKAYNPEIKQHEILYDDDPEDTILETMLGTGAVLWRFLGRENSEGVREAAEKEEAPPAKAQGGQVATQATPTAVLSNSSTTTLTVTTNTTSTTTITTTTVTIPSTTTITTSSAEVSSS